MYNLLQGLFTSASVVPVTSSLRKYGWRRDLPDFRDVYHSLSTPTLPGSVDLRDKMPAIYDQGQLGSCTANAIAGAIHYDELLQKLGNDTPSRLFIYFNERLREGHVGADTGASLRDGIKTIAKQGYCKETEWPYDIEKFTQKPPQACYDTAKTHVAVEYKRVNQNETELKTVLSQGFPVVFGVSVYSSFEGEDVKTTGMVPMPEKNESLLGGHAILLVGYDDEKNLYTFRNSWGTGWGKEGYGFLPYEYVTNSNLAQDFWTVKRVC